MSRGLGSIWSRRGERPHLSKSSALRELELLTSARLTRLQALLLTRVASKESGALQRRLRALIELDERAGDAMTHGLGLRGRSATGDVHLDVELPGLRHGLKGLRDDHAEHVVREIILEGAAVHRRDARTRLKEDARDGGLTLTSSVIAAVNNFGVSHIDLLRRKGAGAFVPRGDARRRRRP